MGGLLRENGRPGAPGSSTRQPRCAADEEDVALSAFKSFWNAAQRDRFPQLTDRTSLWPLLVAITANKCVDHLRHENRQKRGGGTDAAAMNIEQIVGREPTPEFACEVADQLEYLLRRLNATGDWRFATSRFYE